MKLKDKSAIITGATKGIGLAIAEEYAKEGSKVVLTGRSVDLGEDAAKTIRDRGHDAIFVQCDVSQSDQVDRLVSKTVEQYGRLDIMVSNAGINAKAEIVDVKEADWDRVIAVN